MPRSLWTPADLPEPHLYRFLHLGFWFVDTIAICSAMFPLLRIYRGYIKSSGSAVSLVAYMLLCVRFSYFVQPFLFRSPP